MYRSRPKSPPAHSCISPQLPRTWPNLAHASPQMFDFTHPSLLGADYIVNVQGLMTASTRAISLRSPLCMSRVLHLCGVTVIDANTPLLPSLGDSTLRLHWAEKLGTGSENEASKSLLQRHAFKAMFPQHSCQAKQHPARSPSCRPSQ